MCLSLSFFNFLCVFIGFCLCDANLLSMGEPLNFGPRNIRIKNPFTNYLGYLVKGRYVTLPLIELGIGISLMATCFFPGVMWFQSFISQKLSAWDVTLPLPRWDRSRKGKLKKSRKSSSSFSISPSDFDLTEACLLVLCLCAWILTV